MYSPKTGKACLGYRPSYGAKLVTAWSNEGGVSWW
jgi:hypothetical protein